MNLAEKNRVMKEGDMGSELPKGDDARSLIKLWDIKVWRSQGNQVTLTL